VRDHNGRVLVLLTPRERCRKPHGTNREARFVRYVRVMSALPPKADMDQHGCVVRLVPNAGQFTDPSHGTKLIGQCRDRYYLSYEVGMRERSNPD